MAIHRLQGPDGQIHLVEAPDDADPNQLISVVQQQLDAENLRRLRRETTGFLDTAKQGAVRGFEELVSTGKNVIPALGASLFGFDEYAKEKLEQARKEQEARQAERPALFESYKEIEGLGDFGKFVTEKTSEQLANILTSLVPGMGLGAVASRGAATAIGKGLATQAAEKGLAGAAAKQFVEKELAEEAARKAIAGSTLRGEMAGAFLGSYALNAPEVFQNIYENNDKQLAPVAAALFSIGSAALDSILPARLSSQLPNPFKAAVVSKVLEKSGMDKSLVANITTSALKAAGIEGLTEGAQEAISIAAERFVSENPKVFGSKEWNRIMESAVAGAVSGGAFGSIGGSTQGLRARAEAKRQEAAEARKRGDEERAKQLEAEADAASAEIEKLQRPTTEAEQEAYGVAAETGPYSPAQAFGPITPKEFKEQETQFKKDQQALRERLEELSPESYVKEGMPGLVTKKGQLDLVSQAERPTPIEQTLQKAVSPLEQLQERGMRQGELNLEQMRQIGWKEEWNTLVPNIAELAQPEFRKALASDVTIPVETRKGIIEAAKKATLPNGTPIVPRVVKYSYPVESTLMDDLRLRSKDVFGFSPSASVWKKLEGLDAKNPEHVPLIRSAFSEFAEKNPGRATKIEQYLDRLPPTPKLIEGAPDVTGLDQPSSGGGAGVSSEGVAGAASETAGLAERRRVDTPTGYAGQPTRRKIQESSTLTPPEQAAEAQFFGEEQVPIEERGAMLRRKERRELTPEELRATPTEDQQISEVEAGAPVEPVSNKELRKIVKDFFGAHYLDPEKKMYLPKYEGPAFDETQRRLAESGDINGLIRNLLDSNKDPAIKQVLRRIRSLNLKTKLVIGDPVGEFALPALREPFVEGKYRPSVVEWAKRNFGNREYYGTPVWQNFVAWFGDSKIVNEKGEPIVMYHGTARGDIRAFKAKQANAIFVTPEPQFAESFSEDSQQYMDRHWEEFLTKEQVQQAYDDVRTQLIDAESKKSKSLADEFITDPQERQIFLDKRNRDILNEYKEENLTNVEIDSDFPDLVRDARRAYFPSGPNLMPLFVRAKNVFDFENEAHVSKLYNAIEKFIKQPQYDDSIGGLDEFRKLKDYRSEGPEAFRQIIASGQWNLIENKVVQYLIRNVLKHDGFYMFETRFGKNFNDVIGGKNLAVYNQNQVKSVTNRGRFSERPPLLGFPKSGAYDPTTDTIYLDPELGMNAHTFVHEVLHAAISKVLVNKNHPLTKDFEKFFVSIKDRLGDAYGGTDLQEFAAELISNPSFQSLLKSIKAPKSENMFVRIMRAIAEFFGFAETKVGKALLETTALNRGLKFINAAIDISGDVEAAAGERMFLTGDFAPIKDINNAMPSLVGRTIENTRNALSNLTGSSFQEAAFGMLQLGNLKQLFSKELPSIDVLQSALERRAGRQEMEANRINNNYKRFAEVQQRFPEQMETLGDIAIKASQSEVDILKPYEATTADPAKRVAHGTLQAQFKKLDPEVQDVYKTARKDYDDAFKQYRKIIEDAAENMPGLAVKLKEEFERAHPLVGYTPFLRYGDFWLEFVNPQTDAPVAMSFESIRERDQFIEQNLKGIDHQKYQNFDEVQFNAARVPPTHFISKIITGLRQSNASEAQVNAVYQAYLAAFPAESMAKQFIKRRGIEGMEKDFVRGYGNLMLRWSQKLNNSEFLPQIDKALSMIAQEARNQPPEVAAAAKSILRQTDFFHNPTYNSAVRNATAISYYEYMAGNISSGIVNLTSLPLMVFPILSGRFGFSAPGALLSAIKTALPGNNWQNDPKYKDLYQRLMDHGQLEHTLAREVLEGRRKKTQDYTGLTAKITDLVSLPFSVSEKWNRASTAIAAYNLELAKTGDKEKAINYALETVRTAHTSGMAVTSPRWMQTAPGRIFFTFKSIIWQQAYVIARAFHQAAKGESKEIRDAARAQLLSTYGMATVFLGVKGMPFYGALSTLIQMLNALFGDDDEPFNLDELLDKTLPMWLNKGLVNYAFNIELSKRAAIANDLIFRDDPRGIAEHGYVLSAMQQAFGPIGSILINSERSFKLFKDGQYYRAFEAASPATIRNGLKGIRYLTEGALTLKGDPIDTDISTYNGLMQVIGFAPADLSDLYEELAIAKQYETAVKARKKFLLRTYEMASRAADDDLLMEVADKIQKFNEANPRISITSDTLARSRRATVAAQQSSIHGVRFDKKLLPEIKQRFFEEE